MKFIKKQIDSLGETQLTSMSMKTRKKKLDKITKSSQCLQTCTLELLTNLNSFVTKITKDPFELSPENSNFRTTKQFHGFYL